MAAKMTEAEYNAFKKKTGHHEGQKVTTHYETAKNYESGLKHHEERRNLNKSLRSQQRTPVQKAEHVIQSTKNFFGPVVSSVRERASRIETPSYSMGDFNRDFYPRQTGDIFSAGFGGIGPVSDPRKIRSLNAPPARRKKKARRELREEPFDYLKYMGLR